MNYPLQITLLITTIMSLSTAGCNATPPQNTFASDLEILENIDGLQILKSGDSQIAVVGKFQGRVLTSTSKGPDGRSYGYFNRKLIAQNEYIGNYASLGGECRMWFGPEFGKFSTNFLPGTEQIGDNVVRSKDLNTRDFEPIRQSENSVTFGNTMTIGNYHGTEFKIDVERQITLFDQARIETHLGITLPQGVTQVGFEVKTSITNIGDSQWSKATGLLSIWDLGCITPSPNSTVIIPTRGNPQAITEYFTPLDERRIIIKDGIVYYKADADYLNKIGIPPQNTLPIFGSYSPEFKVLTIVQFQFDDEENYVNSHWVDQTDPYAGDVINVFNDGILNDVGPFGPFYEMETSSSSKELAVGESQHHFHTTYHFEGNQAQLNELAQKLLGADLSTLGTIFEK